MWKLFLQYENWNVHRVLCETTSTMKKRITSWELQQQHRRNPGPRITSWKRATHRPYSAEVCTIGIQGWYFPHCWAKVFLKNLLAQGQPVPNSVLSAAQSHHLTNLSFLFKSFISVSRTIHVCLERFGWHCQSHTGFLSISKGFLPTIYISQWVCGFCLFV